MTDEPQRPEPDPTIRAMATISSEVTHLTELVEAKLAEVRTLIEGHFLIDAERFDKIDDQFGLAERVRTEQKQDTKRELDAALTAQKESAGKSEVSIIKLLSEMKDGFGSQLVALGSTVSDVKDRVSKIESIKVGNRETQAGFYAFSGFVVSLIVIGGFLAAMWPR